MFLTFILLFRQALCFKQSKPKLIKEEQVITYDRVTYENRQERVNKYTFSGINSTQNGGAIYILKSNVTVNKCIFEKCTGKLGGAVYIWLYSKNTPLECQFNDCEFKECVSFNGKGGAIYANIEALNQGLYVDQCTFTSNTASDGGAIYALVRDFLSIRRSTFNNNLGESVASLYVRIGTQNGSDLNNSLILEDNTFIVTPTKNLTNVYIVNNQITSGSAKPPTVYLGGCTFEATSATEDIEFLHLEIEDLKTGFSSIEFNKCNCFKQGAETIKVPSKYPFKNINVGCSSSQTCTPNLEPLPDLPDDPSNNQIPDNNTLVSIDVANTIFRDLVDQINKGGGAICVDTNRVNLTVDHCNFEHCRSSNGGAIHVLYAKVNETLAGLVKNSRFENCEANSNGGAADININQARRFSFTFEKCSFVRNKAKVGGAIRAIVRDMFTLSSCTFSNNEATSYGSSLYLEPGWNAKTDSDNVIVVKGNVFTFVPTLKNKINVQIQTKGDNYKNAVLQLGANKFIATATVDGYQHLKIVEMSPYQSIEFTSCNCVQQGQETTTFPESAYPISNFSFNCNTEATCVPTEPIPEPPDAKPDDDGFIPHKRIDDEGKEIDLKKYKFTDLNYPAENGAAIKINADGKRVNCTLLNCKFTSCHGKMGGAIYILMASVKKLLICDIKRTSFENCESESNGGAIYIQNTRSRDYRIEISSCNFTSNKAGKFGGALYLMVCDNFTLSNCNFINNEAKSYGSSIWCRVGGQTNTTDNTATFIDNTFTFTPKSNSINVYIENANVTRPKHALNAVLNLELCRFSATNTDVTDFKHLSIFAAGDGFQSINFPDCICVAQGKETISLPVGCSDSAFTYSCQSYTTCSSDPEGYQYHDKIEDVARTEPINVNNYKFKGLDDEAFGGAITINKQRISCTITKCIFDSCNGKMGGAIYILYAGTSANYTCTITNTVFSNNEAQSNGGAFYCEITQSNRHFVTVSHCTFRSNTAGKNGGAVYAMARDKFTLEHCVFEDNVSPSGGYGSSLWLRVGWNDRYNYNKAIVRNNTFSFNPINKKSVNVHIETYPLLDDTTPNANLEFGLNNFVSGNVNMSGYMHLEFMEKSSPFESINFVGCNCVQDVANRVSIPYPYGTNSFNFNCTGSTSCTTIAPTPVPTPDQNGYTPAERIEIKEGSSLRLAKTKFTNIESNYTGGAVSLVKVSCTITDCKFDACKSNARLNGENNGGGAICISYSTRDDNYTGSIISCQFTNCETTSQGGAINVKIVQADYHSVNIEGCTFTNNKAANNGGAIYANARDQLTIQHCTFTNNEALNGSSLWCQIGWNEGKDVDNCLVLYNNKFSFKPSDTNPVNVFIQSNSLKSEITPNANVFIGLCSFEGENINGGNQKHLVIYEKGAFQSIVFNDCNCIQGNQNTVTISSTVAPNNANLKFECVNMDKCAADDSEQPPATDECQSYPKREEAYGKEITLQKSCFNQLRSTSREGGAVRVINSKLNLNECKFANCSCLKSGGAVYVYFSIDNCRLTANKCVFENCTSEEEGGAFYFTNEFASESSIENCKFYNNNAVSHGGALYYAPCSHSKLARNLFVNNSCTATSKIHGSAVYALIQDVNVKQSQGRLLLADNSVVIEGNKIRSQPIENAQQLYVNLKKTGNVKIGANSFSFNGANVTSANSKYVQVAADEGSSMQVTGQICIDHDGTRTGVVSGINSNVEYDCHKADPEFDNVFDGDDKEKKSNVGMIIGVIIAVIAVIVIVVVVVIFIKRKKSYNRYVSDLGEDGLVDNSDGA